MVILLAVTLACAQNWPVSPPPNTGVWGSQEKAPSTPPWDNKQDTQKPSWNGNQPGTQSSGLSTGAIVGIVIAVIVGLILLALLVVCLIKRKKKNKELQEPVFVATKQDRKSKRPSSRPAGNNGNAKANGKKDMSPRSIHKKTDEGSPSRLMPPIDKMPPIDIPRPNVSVRGSSRQASASSTPRNGSPVNAGRRLKHNDLPSLRGDVSNSPRSRRASSKPKEKPASQNKSSWA